LNNHDEYNEALYGTFDQQMITRVQELAYIYKDWEFTQKGTIRVKKKKDYENMVYFFFSYLLEFMALSQLGHTKIYHLLTTHQENLFSTGAHPVVDGLHLALFNKSMTSINKAINDEDDANEFYE
jgi:hypothetical protein